VRRIAFDWLIGAKHVSVTGEPNRRFLDLGDGRWGVIGVLSLYLYLQVRYTTRLRLENRRLAALERLLEAAGRKA